ncbi:unnamed protein product [Effrenium voratum]|uniref:Uncharacterized protein n=1 Tax=Effrenium voratum TaxID=2562239 RepID=A0AA36IK70_9DINO|nr:unnamed protein product [Effrenium voratum]
MFAMDGRSSGESAAQLAALRGDIAALVREVGQLQGVAKSGAQVSAEESHAVLNQVAALRGQMSTVLDALAPTLQEKASKSDPELANAVSGLSTLCEATMRYCQEAAGGQAALTSQLAELQEETGVMAAALRRLRSVLQGDVENAFKQIINEAAARQDRRCETPRRSLQDFHGLRWREVRHDSREIGREASNALRTQATWERERPRPPPQEVAMLRRMLREHRQAQLAQPSPGSAPSSLPRRQELPERMERPRHALPDSSLSLHRGLMTAPALLQRPQRTRFGSLQHGDMAAQAPASPSPQALFPDVQPSPQSTRFGNLQHGDMAAQALASPSPQALLPDVQPSPQPTKLGNLQPSDMAAQALASPNPQALFHDVQLGEAAKPQPSPQPSPQSTRFGNLQRSDMAAQALASPNPQALFHDVQPSPQSTRFGNLQHGDMAAQAPASPNPQALFHDVQLGEAAKPQPSPQPSPQSTRFGNLQHGDMAAQALASPNPQALFHDVQPSPQSTRFGNLQHGDMAAQALASPNPQALFHDVQPSPQSTRFGNLQHRDMAQAMASPSPIRVESSPPLPAAQQRVRLAAPSPEPSPQLLMQHSTRSWQLVEDIGPENQGPRQQTDGIQSLLQQMLEMQRSQLQLLQSLSQNQVPAALRDVPADQEPLWPPVVATRPWWLTESPARPMRLPEAQASVPKASPLDVQQVHQQLSHLHKIEQELQRMKEMPSRDTHQVYQELMQLQRLQNQLQQVCLQEPQHTRQVLPELQFAHLDQRTITDLPALFSLETEPELVESREVASAFPAPLAGSIARAPSPPPTPQPLRSPPPPPPPAGEREGPQWGDLQLQLREQSWAQEKVVDANRGKGLVKMNELADAGHRAEFMKRQQDSLAARLIHSGLAPELSVSYDSSMSTLPPSGRHESEDTEQRIESEPTSPDQTRLTPHTTAAPSAALATSPPAAGWTHRPEQDLSETHRAEESRLRSSRESQACSLDSGSPSFDGLEGCQHSFIFSPNGHLREALPGRNSSFVPQGAPADDEMGVPPVSSSEEFRPKLVKELLSRARDALNGQAELSPPRDPRSSWPTPSPELPAEVQRQSPEPHPPPARPSPSFGWKELQSHKFRAWFAELEPVNATAALSASSTSAPEVAMPTEPVCLPHSAAAG